MATRTYFTDFSNSGARTGMGFPNKSLRSRPLLQCLSPGQHGTISHIERKPSDTAL